MNQPAINATTSSPASGQVASGGAPTGEEDAARFERALSGSSDASTAVSSSLASDVEASTQQPAPARPSPQAAAVATAAAVAAAHSTAASSMRRGSAGGAATSSDTAAGTAATTTTNDDLTLIRGVDGFMRRELESIGVHTFGQIASWHADDMVALPPGLKERASRENWIEQAQMLAKGQQTDFARRREGGQVIEPVPVPEDALPLAQSTGPQPTAAVQAASNGTSPASPPQVPSSSSSAPAAAVHRVPGPETADLTNLRSVKSEAFRGPTASNDVAPDDLKRIRGVGSLIERKLVSLGITSYEQIANWSAAEIDRISQILDFKGRIERENWVEQARILASGGQTEFSRRLES